MLPAMVPFLNIFCPIKTFKNSLGSGFGISKPKFKTFGTGFETSILPAIFTTGCIFFFFSFGIFSGAI